MAYNLSDAVTDADALLTMIALMPVAGVVVIMGVNFNNPNFNSVEWFALGMRMIVNAAIPALMLISLLAAILWAIHNL